MAEAGDDDVLAFVRQLACLLFENGQTTERITVAVQSIGTALGFGVVLLPRWGELVIRMDQGGASRLDMAEVRPAGVDMNRVARGMAVADDIAAGRIDIATARTSLAAIARQPPASTARFAIMAAAGAAALAVIFGETQLLSLALIALSAGAGALLRRCLAGISHNLFVQPLSAALLAGIIGAFAERLQLSSPLHLVTVCPCMILVPGPHLLNGLIDLARARIPLGLARILYAGLIILMICTGLLAGLALGGEILAVQGTSAAVPFGWDLIAAGVAVSAYGSFFSMPWRTLPMPILIGMLAHACRWLLLTQAGASAELAAFVACLLVGVLVTPIADRLRVPFAAFGFASVVSLIPGVFLFRMAGGLVDFVALGSKAPADLLGSIIADGATALFILLAMAFGLIVPKMVIEHFRAKEEHSIVFQ
jgi:uncharacterized membrane protein YjjP (DUF1212 family)